MLETKLGMNYVLSGYKTLSVDKIGRLKDNVRIMF